MEAATNEDVVRDKASAGAQDKAEEDEAEDGRGTKRFQRSEGAATEAAEEKRNYEPQVEIEIERADSATAGFPAVEAY
ncbi:hypothetical protein M569_05362 [Genlisea aurea]|uniref:Uncharacterized protein n=1 Tax=Genlisea aurea TaxID=192259 RepID=S8EA99_9LAMI|nr:hypothetical protein M569_05362 [Genlisea aurea]